MCKSKRSSGRGTREPDGEFDSKDAFYHLILLYLERLGETDKFSYAFCPVRDL